MGTTAEKLTYLNTTKGLIKDSINALGGNLTNQSTFRSYAAALDSIYNVLPKTTGTGETLSLTPTLQGKLVLDLKGNTSQLQLSGKNLFNDYNTTSSTDRGITYSFTNNEILINGTFDKTGNWNGWLTASNNGTASNDMALLSANTNYTISIYIVGGTTSNTNNQIYISSRDSNKSNFAWNYKVATYDSSTQRYKVSFTTTDSVYISGLRYSINTEATAVFNNLKLKIQIERNNTSTDYEQYCGGTPAPNPSYPQDINVVSGNNTINVYGKNFVGLSNFISMTSDSGITLTNDTTTGKITLNGKTTKTTFINYGTRIFKPNEIVSISANNLLTTGRVSIRLYNIATGNPTSLIQLNNINTVSENIELTDTYDCFQIRIASGTTLTNFDLYPQVELGANATTYEAYQSQTYPITLPAGMELCKIGNYQDSFIYDNDKWYKRANVGKVVLNGSETISIYNQSQSRTNFAVENVLSTAVSYTESSTTPILISNRFIATSQNSTWVVGNMSRRTSAQSTLYLSYNPSTTETQFKTWLASNNVIVYYPLATQTDTEITDTTLKSQLNAIKEATSYTGTTNILQTNNDLPFIIDASCLKGA